MNFKTGIILLLASAGVRGDVDLEAVPYNATGFGEYSLTVTELYANKYYFLDGYNTDGADYTLGGRHVRDCFRFRSRASNDVHVGLFMNTESPTNDFYEVLIGGWGDTKSCVRRGNQGACHHSPLNVNEDGWDWNTDEGMAEKSQGWLDGEEYQHFWVGYWDYGSNHYILAGEGTDCWENGITQYLFKSSNSDDAGQTLDGTLQNIGFSSWDSEISFKSVADLYDASIQTAVDEWIGDETLAEANYGDIGGWTTSRVTDMGELFKGEGHFNEDISNWDTSRVTNMFSLFDHAYAFNGDVSDWDVSEVTNMDYLFYKAGSFNQNLNNWDTSQVTSMMFLFNGANFFNGDISTWDTSRVTNMYGLFRDASSFNGDISYWDTSKVRSMKYMFHDACAFDESYTDTWDTTNADTEYMFSGC